ncbi:DNA-directed RNA polymerase subunit alpha [Candidatus Cerribacteria bacterium 'Amazon FNV 2010 28 9']|uniref:DNA-directed RNA polymerase subunit alpha n=1 Tax=Candidatus Cerribacteria bacterium 'Amazon FNV 2010 28 9' TaxID=2081795 RepID=A0A317JTC5_9BACT|nr:MAG: DNA-directed RNA polymerase subunit alpha [Candidatus Cerribacteria bacterium 'Amazon FNV 2010 28 9']
MVQAAFTVNVTDQKQGYATIAIEPLERGYGQTIGNALRRVLLNSLPGAAVTKIKIDKINHQFTTLEGMSEDIVEFILNVKQIRVATTSDEPVTMNLSVKGQAEVTAGDIETSGQVTIINPELHLATLAAKSSLNVEFTVEKGMGYSMADERKTDAIGVIPVDALFSPIEKVSFSVEATRVGRRTDFDKLVLNVWTNGAISAKDAVEEAAKILVGQFTQVFNPVAVETASAPAPVTYSKQDEVMKLTVEELDLPTRIANALRKGGFKTVADLVASTKSEISKVKNLGGKSIEIVEEAVAKKGLQLS